MRTNPCSCFGSSRLGLTCSAVASRRGVLGHLFYRRLPYEGSALIRGDSAGIWVDQVIRTDLSILANPLVGRAEMLLSLSHSAEVSLRVCDPTGHLGDTIYRGRLGAGIHRLGWDTTHSVEGIAPGIYFVVMDASGTRVTRALVVLR